MTLPAVIGLGSNLGNPETALLDAVAALERAPHVELRALSSGYWTAPVGFEAQPRFLNAAVLVEREISSTELMTLLLGIEAGLGRVRGRRWGPRRIDLDLLWAGDEIVKSPLLELPHPRLAERAFALVPLLELVPEAADPRTGEHYTRRLAELEQEVEPAIPLPSRVARREEEHSADLAFSLRGRTKASTFEAGLNALIDLVFAREMISERERHVVDVRGEDALELFVETAGEIVSLADARELVWKRATLLALEQRRARVALFGEPLRQSEQVVEQVKAVTYHGARLARDASTHRWVASLIVDV